MREPVNWRSMRSCLFFAVLSLHACSSLQAGRRAASTASELEPIGQAILESCEEPVEAAGPAAIEAAGRYTLEEFKARPEKEILATTIERLPLGPFGRRAAKAWIRVILQRNQRVSRHDECKAFVAAGKDTLGFLLSHAQEGDYKDVQRYRLVGPESIIELGDFVMGLGKTLPGFDEFKANVPEKAPPLSREEKEAKITKWQPTPAMLELPLSDRKKLEIEDVFADEVQLQKFLRRGLGLRTLEDLLFHPISYYKSRGRMGPHKIGVIQDRIAKLGLVFREN
jgi:hypothetical protein